jgi:hypothetical protein
LEKIAVAEYRMILNGIIVYLLELASSLPHLRYTILSSLVAKLLGVLPELELENIGSGASSEPSSSLTDFIFRFDDELSSWFRTKYQSLLILGLAFHDFKVALMHCFGQYTSVVIHQFLGSREPHLSILNFAVQIFTVPSIALLACKEGILHKLQEDLRDLFVSEFSESEMDDEFTEERHRLNDGFLEAVTHLTQIIEHIVSSSSANEAGLAQDREYWETAASLILPLQDELIYTHKEGDHVEYEDDSWQDEINLSFRVSRFINDDVRRINQEAVVTDCLAWTGHIIAKLLQEHSEYSQPDQLSFQQPALWLIGSLLQQYSYLTGSKVKPLSFEPVIADATAKVLNRLMEIKVGDWRRNGVAVMAQAMLAPQYWAHVHYMMILWHALSTCNASGEEVKWLLRAELVLDSGISERNQATIRTVIMGIFCGSTMSLNWAESIRCAIVHSLARGPATYSELCKRVPSLFSRDKIFDEIIDATSDIVESSDLLGARKYVLNKKAVPEYNHYYWGYADNEREESLEYMQRRHNYKPLLAALSRQYADAKHMRNFFDNSDLGFGLMCNFVKSVLLKGGWNRLLDDLLTLMNVCMQSGSDLKLNLDQSEKERLYALVDELDGNVRLLANDLLARTIYDYIPRSTSTEKELTEREKSLREARKRKVLESIKAAQTKFETVNIDANASIDSTTEIQESSEMLEQGTCVFCQEPAGKGTLEYGIPLVKSRVRLGTWPIELGDPTPSIVYSSCFHALHKGCYDRLRPNFSGVKKCPLCLAPIKELGIMLLAPPQIPYQGDFLSVLSSIDFQACKSRLSDVITSINSELRPPQKTNLRALGDFSLRMVGCCQQLLALEGTPESASILRLSKYFRAILNGPMGNSRQQGGLQVSQLLPFVTDDSGIKGGPTFTIFQSFIAIISHLFPISTIDKEVVKLIGCMLKIYVIITYRVSNQLLSTSKDSDQRAMAITEIGCKQMLMFLKVWLQADFDIPSKTIISSVLGKDSTSLSDNHELVQWLLKDADLMNMNAVNTAGVAMPFPMEPMKFADLPDEHLDLILDNIGKVKTCEKCGMRRPSICITCGGLICANQSCAAKLDHPVSCSGSNLMLLELYSGSVSLYCSIDIGTPHIVMKRGPTPYVNEHGEIDSDSRHWGPMFLSQFRYDYLKRLYLSGRISSFAPDEYW